MTFVGTAIKYNISELLCGILADIIIMSKKLMCEDSALL